MTTSTVKIRALNTLISIYIAYIVCSVVPALTPNSITKLMPIIVLSGCILLYPNTVFSNKSFICAIFYSIALFLVAMLHKLSGLGYGYGGFDTVMIDLGLILPAVSLGAILNNNNILKHSLRTINIVVYASIIISAIYVIPVLLFDPSIARRLAFMEVEDMNAEMALLKFGFWDYTMCHIIALSFAMFAGLFHNAIAIRAKIFYAIMTFIVLFIVLKLCITTTFIYIIITIPLIINRNFKNFKVIGVVVICILIFTTMFYIDPILDYLLETYDGTAMADKIQDFQDIISGGTGRHATIDGRLDYQQGAIDGFINNVLVGSTYDGTGGHSILLNRLGTTGILGFIPFVMIIYFQFKQWYIRIPEASKYYYLLSWLGVVILLYGKNTFGGSGFLFISLIIPCLAMNFRFNNTFLSPKSYK